MHTKCLLCSVHCIRSYKNSNMFALRIFFSFVFCFFACERMSNVDRVCVCILYVLYRYEWAESAACGPNSPFTFNRLGWTWTCERTLINQIDRSMSMPVHSAHTYTSWSPCTLTWIKQNRKRGKKMNIFNFNIHTECSGCHLQYICTILYSIYSWTNEWRDSYGPLSMRNVDCCLSIVQFDHEKSCVNKLWELASVSFRFIWVCTMWIWCTMHNRRNQNQSLAFRRKIELSVRNKGMGKIKTVIIKLSAPIDYCGAFVHSVNRQPVGGSTEAHSSVWFIDSQRAIYNS